MSQASSELQEKIRQQFDFGPYPRMAIETDPLWNVDQNFVHTLATPYYLRNQRVLKPVGKTILDAGCGTGYHALQFAAANPGAKVIGIDLSEESVRLARQRFEFHGMDNAEFHVLSIDDLPELGLEFDYINCDEVLYLFPDIAAGLQAMKSVLKPQGIIRSNLHSALQRYQYFRAQSLFGMMGLMEDNPKDLEIELVVETLRCLKDDIDLKKVWHEGFDTEARDQIVLMNLLLQGDKGYTIPDLFDALRRSDLEFISMVNWRQWEVLDLFRDSDDLPPFLGMSLPELSTEERLRTFELIHPVHRLLDFWCGHPGETLPTLPINEWDDIDWKNSMVSLHPCLKTNAVREALISSINKQLPFEISKFSSSKVTNCAIKLDSTASSLLLPLWDSEQPFTALAERWLKIRSVNPVTLEPLGYSDVFKQVKDILMQLEICLYVLIEPAS